MKKIKIFDEYKFLQNSLEFSDKSLKHTATILKQLFEKI